MKTADEIMAKFDAVIKDLKEWVEGVQPKKPEWVSKLENNVSWTAGKIEDFIRNEVLKPFAEDCKKKSSKICNVECLTTCEIDETLKRWL
jgi:hypothetical protein